MLNQLNTYSFKLKELELRLKNCEIDNNINGNIIVKNTDNIMINSYNMLKDILDNNKTIIFEINNKKIHITDYKYQLDQKNI